jgi:hypothetical protein
MLTPLTIIWASVTTVLAGLSIYRSILVMYEDDQLFIGKPETGVAAQYAARLSKIKHLESFLKVFTAASGGLLLLMAAIWVYQGLYG